MKKTQENKVSMAAVVLENVENLPTQIVQDTPGLEDNITLLADNIDTITDKAKYQNTNKKGYAIVKSDLKTIMVVDGVKLTLCLKAFAKQSNNEVLFTEMSMTKSDLLRLRDNEAKAKCLLIHTRATQNLAGITTYGVTQTYLNDYKAIIDSYTVNMPKPRTGIVANSLLTKELETAFIQLDETLESLDIKIEALELVAPEIVAEYKEWRKIVNHSGKHLSLKGKVTDTEGNPIFGAMLTIVSLDRSAKSTSKGNFEFKNLPNGQYILEVTRPTFTTQSIMIGVVKGETTETNITLTPANENLRVA